MKASHSYSPEITIFTFLESTLSDEEFPLVLRKGNNNKFSLWKLFLSLHNMTEISTHNSISILLHFFFFEDRRMWKRGSVFFFLTLLLFIYLFIYFLAVLGLRFCARAFSSCGKRGPLFIAMRGPLTIAASLVAEHRLQSRRLSSCGPWA